MTTIEQRTQPSRCFDQVSSFVTRCTLDEMNDDTTEMAALCLLDLIGVAAAGSRLDAGRIARDFAATQMAAGREENGRDGQDRPSHQARLIFDGRPVSLSGAAFAAATQIDNFDAHDGWQPSKGHAGVALFPVLLAVADTQQNLAGREALVSLVVGYEVAYRAALALHATVEDYHTSGAWNGLGAAALAARLRNCPAEVLRQAMGIAEYHGPRSQMMREIANPTMLHDGSGMGALTGLKALLLAEMGFTGAPAATVEFAEAAQYWADLGTVWFTPEQYLKPYPICRWAHASIDAALALRTGDSTSKAVAPEEITSVHIATFSEAAALNNGVPTTSSIAQYSLAWPVAAALAHGRVATETVLESAFGDTATIDMLQRITVSVDPDIDRTFPQDRLARVRIKLRNGEERDSGVMRASGGPDPRPTRAEVIDKFHALAEPVLGAARSREIEQQVFELTEKDSTFDRLRELVLTPL